MFEPKNLDVSMAIVVADENTNKIVVPPNASDTQAAALQIGEAVLPTPTVDLLGENSSLISKPKSNILLIFLFLSLPFHKTSFQSYLRFSLHLLNKIHNNFYQHN